MKLISIGPPREAQLVFPIKLTSAGELDLAKNTKIMGGNRLSLLSGIDPNPNNVSSRHCIRPDS